MNSSSLHKVEHQSEQKNLLNLHWRNIAARNYARANRSKFAPLPRFIFHDALTLVNRSTSFVLFSFVNSLVLLLPENLGISKLKIDFQSAYISVSARIDTVNWTHQQHIAIQFIGFSLSISILSRWNHNDFAYIKTSYFSVNRRHYSMISEHIFLHLTLSQWPSRDGIIYEVRMHLWLVCLDRSIDSIIVNALSLGHWGDGIFFPVHTRLNNRADSSYFVPSVRSMWNIHLILESDLRTCNRKYEIE